MRAHLVRAWRRLERFEDGPNAAPALVALALGVYALGAAAFPLAPGRDLGTYLRASFELRSSDVFLPAALLGRAPVPGVFAEAVLAAGPVVAEAAMAALYVLSILCWWRVGRRLGSSAGIVLPAAMLVFPGYALLFHRLASDALFAAAFALAALLTARLVERPTYARGAALGFAIALLVLIRPVSQVLFVLVPLVLLLPGRWRIRLGRFAALTTALVLPLLGWAVHNAVRADDFTVIRGGGTGLPLYRAFVVDRIVAPENGDASRELARAVRQDLLPREPYRSYGIDLETFFSAGSGRMHEDLIGLADRTWGWDDDYRQLARVGREAVLSHPGRYSRGVARDVWRLVWWPLFLPVAEEQATGTRQRAQGGRLPEPTEGQPIPGASVSAFISAPDRRFREVWTSPTEHGIVSDDPAASAHLHRMSVRIDELFGEFPERDSSAGLGTRLNQASRWFPRPVVWLLVGLVAIAVRRPRGLATPLVLTAAGLLLLVATALAVPATPEYSVPVTPAFLLLAVAGLVGPGVAKRTRERARVHDGPRHG